MSITFSGSKIFLLKISLNENQVHPTFIWALLKFLSLVIEVNLSLSHPFRGGSFFKVLGIGFFEILFGFN
jgi:hypothetical protein